MIFNGGAGLSMKSADEPDTPSKKHKMNPHGGGEGDGSSIEVSKRPRGRPPGSKNKPKPPVVITREAEPSSALRPHILEIPAGHDVIDAIVKFSRRKSLGVCVLAGNGAVSNVTLHQPPHPAAGLAAAGTAATVRFHGRFEILSLSATVMPPAASAIFAPGASVTLAGPQGQVLGGAVAGPLVAAGTVTVVAAAFDNPTFHRLPAVDPAEAAAAAARSVSGDGDESSGHPQLQQEEEQEEAEDQHFVHREYPHHHQHHHHHHQQQQAAVESCGMAIYGGHFPPSDVIWAPTARQPHPPPY